MSVAHAVLAMARNREGGGYVAMKTTVEGAKDEIDVGDQEEPGEWGCDWAKLIGRSVTWKPPWCHPNNAHGTFFDKERPWH
jgi:hypothetical protein